MFAHGEDNAAVAQFDSVFKPDADPPAYLRRCFAEGLSDGPLSWLLVQQLAAGAIAIDAIVDGGNYPELEPDARAPLKELHRRLAAS